MNYAAFNSFGCDSVPLSGENTVVTGGVSCSFSLLGAIVIGSTLVSGVSSASSITDKTAYTYPFPGGVCSDTNAYGKVAALAIGGVCSETWAIDANIGLRQGGGLWSENKVDAAPLRFSLKGGITSSSNAFGKWFLPLTLYSGVQSNIQLGGVLSLQRGFYGGLSSLSGSGGLLRVDATLQNGVSSLYVLSDYPFVISAIIGNEPSYVNLEDSSSLQASCVIDAVLTQKEFISLHEINARYIINAMLQGGIVSVNNPHYNLILSTEMEGGLSTTDSCDYKLKTSINLSGGVVATHCVKANYIKWAVLSGGVTAKGVGDSTQVSIDFLFRDGLASNFSLDSLLNISVVLFGGHSQRSFIDSAIFYDCLMNYGVGSKSIFDTLLNITAKLQNGVETTNTSLQGYIKTNNMIKGGVDTCSTINSELLAVPLLRGGLKSYHDLSNSDISSYYGDMLHNNSALEIFSATIPLEIEIHEGDT